MSISPQDGQFSDTPSVQNAGQEPSIRGALMRASMRPNRNACSPFVMRQAEVYSMGRLSPPNPNQRPFPIGFGSGCSWCSAVMTRHPSRTSALSGRYHCASWFRTYPVS